MARHIDLQKTIIATQEKFNIGSIVNQALIDILIAKQIISEEELVISIEKTSLTNVNVVNERS
jgi:predicted transcriptional regulator